MRPLEPLLGSLRRCFDIFPDKRRGINTTYGMGDIGMAAFSVFFMQSPSFLAHQRTLAENCGRSNAETLFGMTTMPCDNHIRQMLDGAATDHFDSVFANIVKDLDESGGLTRFRRLDGRILIALDGSEHFCSRKLNCPHCSTRKRSDGEIEYFHSFVSATLVAPGHTTVLPLPPEFVRPQDGAKKQDCETTAARRWLSRVGRAYAWLRPIYLGDDIYARQPMCADVLAEGASFIFTCKPSSHKTLSEYLEGVKLDSFSETDGIGSARRIYRYRWMADVPLRDGKDALTVNWLGVTISDEKGKTTYDGAFVTSLPVTADNVVETAACARARWKIENETFNVLKNNGYNLAHNFGHGKKYLARTFAAMNLLAFAFHTACDCLETLWQQAREVIGTRSRFFQDLHTITAYIVFPSWGSLINTLASSKAPPI